MRKAAIALALGVLAYKGLWSLVAVKQYRIGAHKAWMIRGYGVTLSFVTFRMLIEMPLCPVVGDARLVDMSA